MPNELPCDFFICHASEDKDSVARPIANGLTNHGAIVFYDEFSLRIGDSLTETINAAMRVTKNVVVILSKNFLNKKWTYKELNAAFNKHVNLECKLLILWHELSAAEVRDQLPLLADIVALNTSIGIDLIVDKLLDTAVDYRSKFQCLLLPMPPRVIEEKKFTLMLFGLSVFNIGDPGKAQYLFDMGSPGQLRNRLSATKRADRLQIELIDSLLRSISLSFDVSGWTSEHSHAIGFTFDWENKTVKLMIDSDFVSELAVPSNFTIDFSVLLNKSVLGMSLEGLHPLPCEIGVMSQSRLMSHQEFINLMTIMNKYVEEVKQGMQGRES